MYNHQFKNEDILPCNPSVKISFTVHLSHTPVVPAHPGIQLGFVHCTCLLSCSSCLERSLYSCFACLVFLDIGFFGEFRPVVLESVLLAEMHWNASFPALLHSNKATASPHTLVLTICLVLPAFWDY